MLRPWEFYEYTFTEFILACRGHKANETEKLEMVRMLMWSAIAPHSTKQLTPQQLFPLPTDKKKVLSLDRALAIKQRYSAILNVEPSSN